MEPILYSQRYIMHKIWTEIYNIGGKCLQVNIFQINFKVKKLEIGQGNLHKVDKYMKMKTKPTSPNIYDQDIKNRDTESVHNLGDICIYECMYVCTQNPKFRYLGGHRGLTLVTIIYHSDAITKESCWYFEGCKEISVN